MVNFNDPIYNHLQTANGGNIGTDVVSEEELILFAQAIDGDSALEFDMSFLSDHGALNGPPPPPPTAGSLLFHYLQADSDGTIDKNRDGEFSFDEIISVFDVDGNEEVDDAELTTVFDAAREEWEEKGPPAGGAKGPPPADGAKGPPPAGGAKGPPPADGAKGPPPVEVDSEGNVLVPEGSSLAEMAADSESEPIYTILSNLKMGFVLDGIEYGPDGEPLSE